MSDEVKRIMAVAEKYDAYFTEHNADIAIGRKGPHFFYTYDEKYKTIDVFNTFHTAEELEQLIVGTLAEHMECINAVATEDLQMAFRNLDVNERLDEYEPKFHMYMLTKQLEAVSEQYSKWSEMMGKTYESLRSISKDMKE